MLLIQQFPLPLSCRSISSHLDLWPLSFCRLWVRPLQNIKVKEGWEFPPPSCMCNSWAGSSDNHLRSPVLYAGWSANDPVACRSIGKIGICKARSDVWHRSTFGAFISGRLMLLLICATPCEFLMESSESTAAEVHLSRPRKVPSDILFFLEESVGIGVFAFIYVKKWLNLGKYIFDLQMLLSTIYDLNLCSIC